MHAISNLVLLLPVLQVLRGETETDNIATTRHNPLIGWKDFNFLVAIGVKLKYEWKFQCNGVLLAEKKVLSTAQCLFSQEDGKRLVPDIVKVFAGDLNKNAQNRFESDVNSIHIHQNFTEREVENDLGVLLLEKRVPIGLQFTVVRLRKTQIPHEALTCDGAAWKGQTISTVEFWNETFQLSVLRGDCTFSWEGKPDYLICGRTRDMTPKCLSPGGPLVYQHELIAIIHNVTGRCGSDSGTIFTKLWDFREWLDSEFLPPPADVNSQNLVIIELWTSVNSFVFVYMLSM